MSQLNSNLGDLSLVFNGLVNFATTMTVAGDYVVQGQVMLPLLRDNPGSPSAVQVVVKQNSSTKLTNPVGATGFRVLIPAVAVGDVIHVILSSSNAIDNGLNAVQTNLQIYQGDI